MDNVRLPLKDDIEQNGPRLLWKASRAIGEDDFEIARWNIANRPRLTGNFDGLTIVEGPTPLP